MSRPEDRDAMMRPQDPNAEQKPRKASETNWAVHGGNAESFGGKSSKKKIVTDAPPTDLQPGFLPTEQSKLPPVIVTHNKYGTTTGQHSADDERFSNTEAENLKGTEPSINNSTPISAGKNESNSDNQETDEAKAKASLEAERAKETDEEKKKREELEELERLTDPNKGAPVNQATNTTSNKTPNADKAKKTDPVLTTR